MNRFSVKNNTINIISDAIVNSLGFDTDEVLSAIMNMRSGSKSLENFTLSEPTAMLSCIDKEKFNHLIENNHQLKDLKSFTFFEQLMIYVIQNASQKIGLDPADPETLFVFSSTKGNIDLLEKQNLSPDQFERLYIWKSVELITQYFKNPNQAITISNACISGTQAIIKGAEILKSTPFKHVIICGADCISPFVVSGFQSFKALSPDICKPFDHNRTGLNIGEGAGAVVLAKNQEDHISIFSGSVTNDANHISGPSRTGEGLYRALMQSCEDIPKDKISFINAHGTATPYNDEMEAIAFDRSNLAEVPVNSFKANFGHTLGAAGIIETILSARSLENEIILPSMGFDDLGVSIPLTIPKTVIKDSKPYCIKTASGFGGCNAALVLKKGEIV